MAIRERNFGYVTSAASLCFFLLVMVVGFATDPWRHHFSLNDNAHLGVWNNGIDSRLVFFNNSEYGPYRGSMVGLTGSEYPHTNRFDCFGIYYRHFTWPDSVLWTLMVPTWYPIITSAILHFFFRKRRVVT